MACYQLGLTPSSYWTDTGADDGVAIFYDDMNCYGYESRLEYCCHPPVGTDNCSHYEDVWIYCYCKHSDCMPIIANYYSHFRVTGAPEIQSIAGRLEIETVQ